MDTKSLFCLLLPTLATLHLCSAEDQPLVGGGAKSSLDGEVESPLNSLTPEDKKRWSNFHSWGKRWGDFASWGKRAPSELPEKKWTDSAFTAWGKRDMNPEQKRNWNQFVTWGKRNWHSMSAWGKRAHDTPYKKWNTLTSWGKRAGWDSGFTAWGKRAVDVTDELMKLFDENDDGVLDGKEVGRFLTWLGSLSKELPPRA